MASEVKVKVSLQSGVATGLTKVKAQFAQFRRDLNSQFANFLAFGAITAGLDAMIKKGAEIQHLSDRFGAPAKELQRVANVAKESGGSMEDVARAWNKLTVNKQKAIDGNDEARKSFEDLGVSMKDVANLSIEQLFYRIADATKDATDHDQAYAAVFHLMGRNAGTLFSTLQKGAGAIKAQGDAIGVMSDKSVKQLERMNADIEQLKTTLFKYGGETLVFVKNVMESVGVLVGTTVNQFQNIFSSLGSSLKLALTGHFIEAGKELANGAKAIANEVAGAKGDLDKTWNPAAPAKQKAATDVDVDPSKSEEAHLDKLQALRDRLAELQRKTTDDQLEGEEKINALIKQRAALVKAAAGEKDEEKRLELQIKSEDIGKEIAQARKAMDKETDDAQDRYDKAHRDRAYAELKTDADRAKFLQNEIAELTKKIALETDATEKLNLQSQREGLLTKFEELGKKDAPKVVADSLQRIGGGGNAAVTGVDNTLREQKVHTQLLRKLVENTKPTGKNVQLLMKP
jgi:hypothetical protein